MRREYEDIARNHASSARARPPPSIMPKPAPTNANSDLANYTAPAPTYFGTRQYGHYDLGELAPYIDWTPFFQTWELAGRYPSILQDDKVGKAARDLFADAQKMLSKIIEGKWLTARAAIGFWPANAEGDDIVLFGDKARKFPIATLHTLRQQMARDTGRPNLALADFIAPRGHEDYHRRLCRHRRDSAKRSTSSASRTPRTITPPSCCARWPTAWPKPLPNGCTKACAANSGAMRRTKR